MPTLSNFVFAFAAVAALPFLVDGNPSSMGAALTLAGLGIGIRFAEEIFKLD